MYTESQNFRALIRRSPTGSILVEVFGDIDAVTVGEFGRVLTQAADEAPETLDVDLTAVTHFSSTAVATLLACHQQAAGAMRVTGTSRPVQRVVTVAGVPWLLQ